MEILQLRYFCELAKTQHLTKTADEMMVYPSAISNSIKRLEEELEVKLFDRVGRNIVLNDNGKIFLKYAMTALNALDDGKKTLRDRTDNSETHLIVATTDPYVWQNAIGAFHEAHPEIHLSHVNFSSLKKNSTVEFNFIDVVIASPEVFSTPLWDSKLLINDRIVLAVTPAHRFADRQSIDIAEAKDELFVQLPPCAFREKCDDVCRNAGFNPKSKVECDYIMRPKMLEYENMVCLTTYHGKSSGVFKDAVVVPLTNEDAVRKQSIFWPRTRYKSQAAKTFIDFMVGLYKDCTTGEKLIESGF